VSTNPLNESLAEEDDSFGFSFFRKRSPSEPTASRRIIRGRHRSATTFTTGEQGASQKIEHVGHGGRSNRSRGIGKSFGDRTTNSSSAGSAESEVYGRGGRFLSH
jgi:hypothetical protein